MTEADAAPREPGGLFSRAEWYERTIDWTARLAREIPVLVDVFGPPGNGRILDAGCGTGRHACALAAHGYTVVGADIDEEMLGLARPTAQTARADVRFACTPFRTISDAVGGGFDGVYCIGNSLVAAGARLAVEGAVEQLTRCLRPGGRLFVQTLNFPLMRTENPCVRGPKVKVIDAVEYVSLRHYHFAGDSVQIIHTTLFKDSQWRCHTHAGTVYPVTLDELRTWCASRGLRIDNIWGSYNREAFSPQESAELLLLATRE